jgi:hypothetical protein
MDESRPNEEQIYNEARVHSVEQRVKKMLPEYSQIDRSEYDAYVRENDVNDRGQILFFYPSAERRKDAPQILFIFRPTGFVLNYYNTPEPSDPNPNRIRNRGNSLYGRRQNKWQLEETEYALERARIHMEGIDYMTDEFRSQLAGWNADKDVFVTMGERLDALNPQNKKGKRKSPWEKTAYTIWDVYEKEPNKATELAIRNIERGGEYVGLDGSARPIEEVVREIREGTVSGQKAVLREMYKIESYERLLKDRSLL